MTTVKEAREAVDKLASTAEGEGEVEKSADWKAGVEAFCKKANLNVDEVMAAIDKDKPATGS